MTVHPIFVSETEVLRFAPGDTVAWPLCLSTEPQSDWPEEWRATITGVIVRADTERWASVAIQAGDLTAALREPRDAGPATLTGLLCMDELTPRYPWPFSTGVVRRIVEVAQTFRLRQVEYPERMVSAWLPIDGALQHQKVEHAPAGQLGWRTTIQGPAAELDTRRIGWVAWVDVSEEVP